MKYEKKPDMYWGDNKNRFVLGVTGKRPFIVFGVNPSIADDQISDRTISKITRFAEQYGCDGWIMLNLYPQRSTKPSELHKISDDPLHEENIDYITRLVGNFPNAILCAAWGTPITRRDYLYQCLKEIRNVVKGQWKSIGPTTLNGHPKHPSRLSYKLELQNFDIDKYLQDPHAFRFLAKDM